MTYIAVAALVVALTAVVSTGGIVRSLIRSHARERQTLLDQMMHLAGRTWTPPPAYQPEPVVERDTVRNFDQQADWDEIVA